MIDVLTETILPLKDARKFLPGQPDRVTIWRWATHGCDGVVLETFKCARKPYTTREAIVRFIEAQNQPESERPSVPARRRQKADDSAQRERLTKAGLLK